MQTQFLSNKDTDPTKPSHQSINLPNINEKQPLAESGTSTQPKPANTAFGRQKMTASQSSKGYLSQHPRGNQFQIGSPTSYEQVNLLGAQPKLALRHGGKMSRSTRGSSKTRPLMHIRDGKLLISQKPT